MQEKPTDAKIIPDDSVAKDIESKEDAVLVWGEDFGKMSWKEAWNKLEELNKDVKEGEKPWRFPTANELLDAKKKGVSGFKEAGHSYENVEYFEVGEAGREGVFSSPQIGFVNFNPSENNPERSFDNAHVAFKNVRYVR
ncbi:MAG: hypothetical protein WCJ74_02425 [bacterium]